jgi:hypothetical protein
MSVTVKYQHYHPCSILMKFGDSTDRRKAKLQCLFPDKDISYQVSANKIGGENYLYEPLSSYVNEIETLLNTQVDNKASNVLSKTFYRKVLNHKPVTITQQELRDLYTYAYSLLLRHPSIVKSETAMENFLPLEQRGNKTTPLAYGNFLKNFLHAVSNNAYKIDFYVTHKGIPVNLTNPVIILPSANKDLPKLLVTVGKNLFMIIDTSHPVEQENIPLQVWYENEDSAFQAIDFLLSNSQLNSMFVYSSSHKDYITEKVIQYRQIKNNMELGLSIFQDKNKFHIENSL